MCGIVDDLLPVIGGIAGSFVAPGIGTAIGAGLGGSIGNYAQTHNFGSALGAGAISGGTSLLGSELGNYLGGAGGAGGFTGGAGGADTLGGLESAAGGASLFGPTAGMGTAIGNAAGGLGGGGLGIAGGQALGGIGTGLGYLGGLGGSAQGTGLGLGGIGSQADLNGALQATGGPGGITSGITPTAGLNATSPVAGAAGTSPTTGANPMGALSNSGAVMQGGGGVGQSLEAGAQGAAPEGSLSSIYGPTSLAGGSPQGALIAQAGQEVQPGVQFGAMGAGTPASVASPTTLGDIMRSPEGMGTAFKLANAGLGAYQDFARQRAANDYANSIRSLYSPNSPYAQQMAQTLARQDAAAGRNSQYGNRAVQLAAALTNAQSQALANPAFAQAAQARPGTNALNNIFAQFATPQAQQGLANFGSSAFNSLASLFGG